MTQQDIAARKTKMYILAGVGIAALIASYVIGYAGPGNGVSAMTEIVLTAFFLGCIFIAGMTAVKLNKETAAK